MRTKHYKTVESLMRHCSTQMTMQRFFEGRSRFNDDFLYSNFTLPQEEYERVSRIFAKFLYCKPTKYVIEKLSDRRGDFSYFQCFYLEVRPKSGIYISTSLGGESFNYCRRKYLAS